VLNLLCTTGHMTTFCQNGTRWKQNTLFQSFLYIYIPNIPSLSHPLETCANWVCMGTPVFSSRRDFWTGPTCTKFTRGTKRSMSKPESSNVWIGDSGLDLIYVPDQRALTCVMNKIYFIRVTNTKGQENIFYFFEIFCERLCDRVLFTRWRCIGWILKRRGRLVFVQSAGAQHLQHQHTTSNALAGCDRLSLARLLSCCMNE